jgi:glycosyltransferase involved in cell wall biosynthesis
LGGSKPGDPLSAKAPLAVLIPTLNEERNLATALESCAFAEQRVVLDSFSQDRTEAIAREHGAEFVEHRFENYSKQKNWALDNIAWRHRWIFILDADERFTPELAEEVSRIVRGGGDAAGYYVNRKLIFMGHWIKHCGWYPNWNLRLFQLGRARYDGRPVHEHMVVQGPVAYLTQDMIHDDQKGLEDFIARHNRYSSLEARTRSQAPREPVRLAELRHPVRLKRAVRQWVWPLVPAKPMTTFLYYYLLRAGFLDGRAGLIFSALQGFQELHVNLKMRELKEPSADQASD